MVEGSLDGSWHFYNSSYGLYLAPAPGDPVKDDYLGPWFDLIATTELHYWRIKEITNDLTKESGYRYATISFHIFQVTRFLSVLSIMMTK